jgi:hypothetical protein
MSAACLADSMPHIDSILPGLILQATEVIQKKMSVLRNSPNVPPVNISIDLLFAVFAMGTSLHWTDDSQAENTLLENAREGLGLLQMDLGAVDAMGSHSVVPKLYRQALIQQ